MHPKWGIHLVCFYSKKELFSISSPEKSPVKCNQWCIGRTAQKKKKKIQDGSMDPFLCRQGPVKRKSRSGIQFRSASLSRTGEMNCAAFRIDSCWLFFRVALSRSSCCCSVFFSNNNRARKVGRRGWKPVKRKDEPSLSKWNWLRTVALCVTARGRAISLFQLLVRSKSIHVKWGDVLLYKRAA